MSHVVGAIQLNRIIHSTAIVTYRYVSVDPVPSLYGDVLIIPTWLFSV